MLFTILTAKSWFHKCSSNTRKSLLPFPVFRTFIIPPYFHRISLSILLFLIPTNGFLPVPKGSCWQHLLCSVLQLPGQNSLINLFLLQSAHSTWSNGTFMVPYSKIDWDAIQSTNTLDGWKMPKGQPSYLELELKPELDLYLIGVCMAYTCSPAQQEWRNLIPRTKPHRQLCILRGSIPQTHKSRVAACCLDREEWLNRMTGEGLPITTTHPHLNNEVMWFVVHLTPGCQDLR